jgi:8-oxo-dGTP diphosphatase
MPPGGYSKGLAEPEARSVQETSDQGRRVTFTWFDPPFRPEPPHSNQAYGICFTEAGMIVLGAWDGDGERYWNLLGGGVEPGETLEDCLAREVMEEGCARVTESRYIGCQRVDDPDHPTGPWRYYQARFWARVELLRWDPQHEINERRLVRP